MKDIVRDVLNPFDRAILARISLGRSSGGDSVRFPARVSCARDYRSQSSPMRSLVLPFSPRPVPYRPKDSIIVAFVRVAPTGLIGDRPQSLDQFRVNPVSPRDRPMLRGLEHKWVLGWGS